MKKLMTMIAAVATAFGLFAADPDYLSGTSFEAPPGGALSTLIPLADELIEANGAWNIAGGEATVVAYATAGVDKYTGDRPQQFNPDNFYFLNLKTGSDELTRYALGTQDDYDVAADGNYYFDSVVQLSAFDQDPSADITDAKLALWLLEDEDAGTTNLMIKVGSGDVIVADGDYSNLLGNWARVTIKALPISASQIGFVLFIDTTAVVVDPKKTVTPTLNAIAQAYQKDGVLIVSTATTDAQKISNVGFKGTGLVDDIVFTQTVPGTWAEDPAVVEVKLNQDAAEIVTEVSTNDVALTLPAIIEKGVTVVAKASDSYMDRTYTNVQEPLEIKASDFTAAVAKFNDEKCAELNGTDGKSAVEKANAAQANCMITLLENGDAISIANTKEAVVTINLGGWALTGSEDDSTIDAQSAVVVSNGTVTAGTDQSAIYGDAVTIYDGTFNGGVAGAGITIFDGVFNGAVEAAETTVIHGGHFLASANEGLAEAATFDDEDKTLIVDPADANYLIVGDKAKPGTVIFVCSATGYTSDAVTAVDQQVTKPADDVIDANGVFTVKAGKWYKEATFENEFDFDTDTIADDTQVPLYAQADVVFTGSGTEQDPYQIATPADLRKLDAFTDAGNAVAGIYFKQMGNIDMNNETFEGIGGHGPDREYKTNPTHTYKQDWYGKPASDKPESWNEYKYTTTQAQCNDNVFKSVYDGNGKTVSNLKFSRRRYGGLFNVVLGGTVKNLTVENISYDDTNEATFGIVGCAFEGSVLTDLEITGNVWSSGNVGAIACTTRGATLTRCTCSAEITNIFTENATFGGIVGYAYGGTVLDSCVMSGTVDNKCYQQDYESNGTGGLIGSLAGPTTIKDCTVSGTVKCAAGTPETGKYTVKVGTIIGQLYAAGTITVEGTVTAVAGLPIGYIQENAKPGCFAFSQAGTETGTVVYAPLAKEKTYDVVLNVAEGTTAFTLAAENDWIAFKPATGVTFAGTVAVADTETLEVKPEEIDGGTKYKAVKKAVGPKPDPAHDDCEVTPNGDGSYTVTPKDDSTTATVKGVKATDTLKITSAADFVLTTDVEPQAIVMELNGNVIDGKYFKGGDPTKGFDTALSDEAKATLVTETEDVKPLVVGDNVAVTINTVAGLKYQLVRGIEVGTIKTPIGEAIPATGKTLELKDITAKPEGGKAFYVIKTSK